MPKRNAVIIAAVVGIMLVGTLVGFYMEHRRWEAINAQLAYELSHGIKNSDTLTGEWKRELERQVDAEREQRKREEEGSKH